MPADAPLDGDLRRCRGSCAEGRENAAPDVEWRPRHDLGGNALGRRPGGCARECGVIDTGRQRPPVAAVRAGDNGRRGRCDRPPLTPMRRAAGQATAPRGVGPRVLDRGRPRSSPSQRAGPGSGRACSAASGRTGGRGRSSARDRPRGGARSAPRSSSSCSWVRGGTTVSTRTSTVRPSQASLRSSPIGSCSASSVLSRRRLSSAGTSSARCVAGVPGRSE